MEKKEITIKKATVDDWKVYKVLRLQSQRTDPQAFGGSIEEERAMSDDAWKEKVASLLDHGVHLFAMDREKAVGMIRISYERKEKFKHIAHLMAFYVDEKYRGRGIGKMLIDAALAEIRTRPGIIKVKLCVNPDQKAAMKLYERFGFQVTGKSEEEMKIGDTFYDSWYLEKFL